MEFEQIDDEKIWWNQSWHWLTGCPPDKHRSLSCRDCYARRMHKRLQAMGSEKYQHDFDASVQFHPEIVERPLSWRRPRVVFVNSMSDTFHEQALPQWVDSAFRVMAATPLHTYLVLTKRGLRMRDCADRLRWPENVWAGVTVENRDGLERRFDYLTDIDAKVRFISAEPLFDDWILKLGHYRWEAFEWFIFGGETGKDTTPLEETLVREVIAACHDPGKAVWFKQWGGSMRPDGGELDGRVIHERPVQT